MTYFRFLCVVISTSHLNARHDLMYTYCAVVSTSHLNTCSITLLWSPHNSEISCNRNTIMCSKTWILCCNLRCDAMQITPSCMFSMCIWRFVVISIHRSCACGLPSNLGQMSPRLQVLGTHSTLPHPGTLVSEAPVTQNHP